MPRVPACGHDPRREPDAVPGLEHRRKCEEAHQRHARADDPGRGGEDRAGDDRRDGERPGDAGGRQVEALEEPADQVGPFDEIPHEDEQGDRYQYVVVHDRIGALHRQLERMGQRGRRVRAVIVHEAEHRAHAHQRECRGKAEHDRDDDHRQHQEAQMAVGHL